MVAVVDDDIFNDVDLRVAFFKSSRSTSPTYSITVRDHTQLPSSSSSAFESEALPRRVGVDHAQWHRVRTIFISGYTTVAVVICVSAGRPAFRSNRMKSAALRTRPPAKLTSPPLPYRRSRTACDRSRRRRMVGPC